jgi:hypothetical protein
VLEKTSGDLSLEAHGWATIRDKTYGSTQVLFLQRSQELESGS